MPNPREVLTPEALTLLQAVAQSGSFAAAARDLGLVPSAVTYRIRQIEDALDVLLFDRSSRQARLTPAGTELLREGGRLLSEIDAVANRVKRVATGWESQLTIAYDTVVSTSVLMELVQAFYAGRPVTRLRLKEESLSGTLEALVSGRADLALGVLLDSASTLGIQSQSLGEMAFIFAVAPHHPLAALPEPLPDEILQRERGVAVADTTQRGSPLTYGLLAGQDVLTVPTMRLKLDAQLRGLGAGFVPEPMARPYLETGQLVAKQTQRGNPVVRFGCAWRAAASTGRALQWRLAQLASDATRRALIEQQRMPQ